MEGTPFLSFYFSYSLLGDLRVNKITPKIAATTVKIIANTISDMAPATERSLIVVSTV